MKRPAQVTPAPRGQRASGAGLSPEPGSSRRREEPGATGPFPRGAGAQIRACILARLSLVVVSGREGFPVGGREHLFTLKWSDFPGKSLTSYVAGPGSVGRKPPL